MPLVSLDDISIRFRGPALLEDVSCAIEKGQKIGLLGRNGAGKSTLMKLISGQLDPDHGQILFETGTTVSQLPQEVPRDTRGTIAEIVSSGLADRQEDPQWTVQNRVDKILSRMELQSEDRFEALSSGMKRRVLLAQCLVSEPSLLLLDEPTNHLDIGAIRWLEDFLVKWKGTLLFVTHDRAFLQKLANRILEIDRGKIFDWSCSYDKFLERKNAALEAEEKQNALFDKKLAQEEVWIRKGIKARRKRNQGRVRALKDLRVQRSQRRDKMGTARIQIQTGQRSGNLIAEVEEITFSYGAQPIVQRFSTEILRGDKVGLIGPNGAGKTTLLNLLLGKLKPESGKVRLGTHLEIAYFDQLRGTLDEQETVQHNVADGYETIQLNGKSKHVLGYLQDFLFPPERARTQVKYLSGGERNRLLLARLFAKTANVLVLDEPTNDLDAETLELLEEKLVEYEGTVLLVSHDRTFLNNVVTSSIVFENGNVREYDGGYDDWIRQSASSKTIAAAPSSAKPAKTNPAATPERPDRQKLSYRETRELQELPARIESLESEIGNLHEKMADGDYFRQPKETIASDQRRLDELNQSLVSAFERWEELESLQ
ncbi:MAG: ATP-binding cassette domain-containing protein [Planctomycetota bacterium]|nr:ATP-binding cassette domain-containing protein [Planctomycetota bacterium]